MHWILGAVVACVLCVTAAAATQQEIRGTVTDRSGAVIARAQVVLHVNGQNFGRVTQPDGTFVFSGIVADSGTIEVRSSGFATATATWTAGDKPLAITLLPAAVQQSLDVTATRTSILPTGVDNVEAQPDAVTVSDNNSSNGDRSQPMTSFARCRASDCCVAPVARPLTRHRKASRCADSAPAEPAARWCWSTVYPSTIPSADGSTGRACRNRHSAKCRLFPAASPRYTATTRWAASSTWRREDCCRNRRQY